MKDENLWLFLLKHPETYQKSKKSGHFLIFWLLFFLEKFQHFSKFVKNNVFPIVKRCGKQPWSIPYTRYILIKSRLITNNIHIQPTTQKWYVRLRIYFTKAPCLNPYGNLWCGLDYSRINTNKKFHYYRVKFTVP